MSSSARPIHGTAQQRSRQEQMPVTTATPPGEYGSKFGFLVTLGLLPVTQPVSFEGVQWPRGKCIRLLIKRLGVQTLLASGLCVLDELDTMSRQSTG